MLNKLLSVLCVFLIAASFLFATPAWAADASKGAKIFSANCASCHAGGNNLVNATKTLKKDALEKYDMYSLEAVKNQIINGKNAMPAFGGRLSDEQIDDVATYVLSQADKGW
jgi:cytochrome c6